MTGCVQSEQSGINDFSAKPAEGQTAGPGLGLRGRACQIRQSRGTWPDARWPPRNIASLPHLVLCRPSRVFVAVAGAGDGSERMFLDSSSFSSPMLGRPPSRWRPTGLDGAVFGSLGVFGCTRACLSICSISRPAGTRHWKISQRRPWEPFVAEPLPYFSGGAAGSRDPEADGLPERQHWLACRDPVEPPGTAASRAARKRAAASPSCRPGRKARPRLLDGGQAHNPQTVTIRLIGFLLNFPDATHSPLLRTRGERTSTSKTGSIFCVRLSRSAKCA